MSTTTKVTPLAQIFAVALEGDCDPRREPELGARMDALLDGLSEEQLDAIRAACLRLDEAATCAQIRNYGFKPQAITGERVDEIVEKLNSFRVYEFEGGTDLVNGRAVPIRDVVGCDFNLEQAIDWALTQPEVSTTGCDDDGNGADITLRDGTAIEWIPEEKQWSVVFDLDENVVAS